MNKRSVLLETQKIKSFEFTNRYACAPFDIAKATGDGLITDEILSIYSSRKGSSLIVADTSLTGMEAVAPSAVINPVTKRSLPRELTLEEIYNIKNKFVEAALRVKKAGFDGVEIHNCHGFLLSQFLSPITNLRTDKYGGTLENRSRLLLELKKLSVTICYY